jgi:hypothetical protein
MVINMIKTEKFDFVSVQSSGNNNSYRVVAESETTDEFDVIMQIEYSAPEVRIYRFDNPPVWNGEAEEYKMLDRVIKTGYPDADLDDFEHYLRQEIKNRFRFWCKTWTGLDNVDRVFERIVEVEVDRVVDNCAEAHRERELTQDRW